VAFVSVFSVSEKVLGFLYRIYLSHSIGAEGIGIYSVALSIFGLFYTLCCSGVPITVSRLMTKYKAQKQHDRVAKIITAGICLPLLFAIPVCLIFYFSGSTFSFLFADKRSFNVFLIILPGLTFTCVYSVLRGVFWGNKDFLPYSVIELLEEIVMIIMGIILISYSQSVYQGAFRAGVAVLISYVFSFALALGVFFLRKNRFTNPTSEFKPLFKSAMPITAMRSANSFAVSLVSILLPLRLISAGFSEAEAMRSFGAAMGQALPIISIPTTLIGSFTLVLIPEISESFYNGRHYYLKRDVEKAIKFTSVLTMAFIPVFFVCGEEIGMVIFGEYECGKYIKATAFLMIFMSLSSLSTSILNSMGLETKTLIFYIVSGGLMLLSIWFLPSVIGIYSLLIGFTFVFGLTTVLNLWLLNKHCPEKPKYVKFLITAFLTTLPSILFGALLERLLLSVLGTFFTLFTCAIFTALFNILMYFGFGLVTFNKTKTMLTKIFAKKKTA
jgi:stage V sporulation protein B